MTKEELLQQYAEGKRDFSGADLYEAFLSGANLIRADLSRANLSRANLSRANLSGANLTAANLSLANLSGANFSRVNFSRAVLYKADLSGAGLYGADLSKANLTGANLTGANLSGASLSGTNLFGANLFGANLIGANLTGTGLSGAQLKEVIGYSPEVAAACAPSLRDVTPAGTRTPELCEAKMLEWSAGMLAKLKSGTAKGRPDWHNKTETSVEALVLHLFAEIHEFFAAGGQAERMREAADVANVVHMLAEHIGNDPAVAARALAAAKMVRQTYVG